MRYKTEFAFQQEEAFVLVPATLNSPPSVSKQQVLVINDEGFVPTFKGEDKLTFRKVEFERDFTRACLWFRARHDEWQDMPFKQPQEQVKSTQPQRRVGGGGILDMLSKLLPFSR